MPLVGEGKSYYYEIYPEHLHDKDLFTRGKDFIRAFSHLGEKGISLTPAPSSLPIWEEEDTKKLGKVTVQGLKD